MFRWWPCNKRRNLSFPNSRTKSIIPLWFDLCYINYVWGPTILHLPWALCNSALPNGKWQIKDQPVSFQMSPISWKSTEMHGKYLTSNIQSQSVRTVKCCRAITWRWWNSFQSSISHLITYIGSFCLYNIHFWQTFQIQCEIGHFLDFCCLIFVELDFCNCDGVFIHFSFTNWSLLKLMKS